MNCFWPPIPGPWASAIARVGATRRGADGVGRPVVERDGKTIGRFDQAGLRIEPRAARAAGGAPYGFFRIERDFRPLHPTITHFYSASVPAVPVCARRHDKVCGRIKRAAMRRLFGAILVLLAVSASTTAEADSVRRKSLVRNVYGYYGDRTSDLSSGLRATPSRRSTVFSTRACGRHGIVRSICRTIFLSRVRTGSSARVSISILRRQFDRTMSRSPSTITAARSR